MNTTQTEMEKVAKATTLTVLAIDPSLPRAEQVSRIRAALATLAGIAEE